ncbi:hypothetical protein OG552_05790 [Streptomyces sp. NBC_01476]|uniref:DUF2470 domain-containing protein n=1 Tax=Streptomyces sp. NBC_01476 TaxID=2903881 RepID=UPI002E30AFC2|nr:DUF2470 domain-containing protein [Streptomyces sp. NBC_01476]
MPDLSNESEHSQPRPVEEEEAPRQPTAAERARTLVEGNPSLALTIPGLGVSPEDPMTPMTPLRHSVGPDGDLFLLVPRHAPAARAVLDAGDEEVTAVLEITDVAPVAVPHRIRGRAWIAGWLTPVPCGAFEAGAQLLRLEPGEITVDDLWGAGLVEPDEFAAAEADPLRGCEAEVLQHLAAAHQEEVGLLCGLIASPDGGCGPRAAAAAVPLALDRFGLRVRFTADDGVFDARFDFPEPAGGLEDAQRSMRALFAAAREE